MNVQSILNQKGHEVVTISPHDSISQAAEKMARKNIGALVVTHGEKVTGVVTNRDIAHAFSRAGWHLAELRVEDVMRAGFVPVAPDDSIKQVMALMTRRRVTHLPVLESNRLIGLVSIGDVVKHQVDELELETGILRDAYVALH